MLVDSVRLKNNVKDLHTKVCYKGSVLRPVELNEHYFSSHQE